MVLKDMANLNDDTFLKVEPSYCFLCGNAAVPIIPRHKFGTTEDTVLQNWTYECTSLLPAALKIDVSLGWVFQNKGYCSQCLNTVREINFLHKSIESFQKRLSHFCKSVKNSLWNQAKDKGLMKSCIDVESESIDVIVLILHENQNVNSTPLSPSEYHEFLDPLISPIPSTNDEEQITLCLFPDKRSIPKDPLPYHQKLRKIAPKPPSIPVLLIQQPQLLHQPVQMSNQSTVQVQNNDKEQPLRYPCSWAGCKFVAYTKDYRLRFHVNKVHLKDPTPYHCTNQHCIKKFPTANHLRGHAQIHKDKSIKNRTSIAEAGRVKFHESNPIALNEAELTKSLQVEEINIELKEENVLALIEAKSENYCDDGSSSNQATIDPLANLEEESQGISSNQTKEIVRFRSRCTWPDCKYIAYEKECRLIFHINRIHLKDPKPYHCENCDLKFITYSQLRGHCNKHTTRTSRKNKIPKSPTNLSIDPADVDQYKGFVRNSTASKRLQRLIERKKRLHKLVLQKTVATTKKFSCTFPGCTNQLSSAGSLQRHQRLKHNHVEPAVTVTAKKFPCKFPGCTKELSHAWTLQRHQHLKHNYDEPYQRFSYCKFCALAFKQKVALLEHLKVAHKDESLVCRPKMINRRRLLMNNTAPSPDATQIPCNLCSFLFERQNEKEMELHLQIHKQREIENRKFSCVVENCEKFFVNSFHLKAHVLAEHSIIGIQCQYCSNVVSNMNKLKAHMKFYHGSTESLNTASRKYNKCSQCNFKAIDKSVLKDHMVSHSAARKFSCSKCSETFRYRQSLRHHMIRHLPKEQWPFQCTVSGCNASFVMSGGFRAHEESHAATKTYICEYCSNSYRTHRYLNTHIRVVHKIRKRTETYITHKT